MRTSKRLSSGNPSKMPQLLRLVLALVALVGLVWPVAQAFAAHWTDLPFPNKSYRGWAKQAKSHNPDPSAVDELIQDTRGNIWVGTLEAGAYVLPAGSSVWKAASQGLEDRSIQDLASYQDKVFLNTTGGVFGRSSGDKRWHKISSFLEPQVYDLTGFDGYIWGAGSTGVHRLNLRTEKWESVNQGLPKQRNGYSYNYPSTPVATRDYLYVGFSDDLGEDPTFSRAGVYRLKKGTSAWENTRLKVSPRPGDLGKKPTKGTNWGVHGVTSVNGYVVVSVLGQSGEYGRLFVYSESKGSWRQVPPSGQSTVDNYGNTWHTDPRPPAWDGKLWIHTSSESDGKQVYAIYDPKSERWEADRTVTAKQWHPINGSDVYVVGNELVVSGPWNPAKKNRAQGFVNSVPLPTQVSRDPQVVGTNMFLAVLFAAAFGLSSSVFNNTIKDNHEDLLNMLRPVTEVLGGTKGVVTTPGEGQREVSTGAGVTTRFAALSRLLHHRLLRPIAIVVLTAFIYGFLDPGFGFSVGGLGLFLSLVVSVGAVTYTYEGLRGFVCCRRYKVPAGLAFYPAAMGIAVGCVIFSRLVGFQPGYLYGFVGGMAFLSGAEPDDDKMGRLMLLSGLALLGVSLVAWFLAVPLTAAAGGGGAFMLEIARGACVGIFVAGLEGLLFGLIPLSFMDGEKIFRWNKWIWLASFGTVAFLFWHVLLNKNSKYLAAFADKNVKIMAGLVVLYCLATLGTYVYFRKKSRAKASPA